MTNIFERAFAYAIPASSFQYVKDVFKNFVDYGVSFGPDLTPDEKQYRRVKAVIRSQMIAKEGYRNDVYRDSLQIPTVGIGHKVLVTDFLKVGQIISDERIEDLFENDIHLAITAAIKQAKELGRTSDEFVAALVQVNFQLGIYWRTKFPSVWNDLKSDKWQSAINKLAASNWNKQTPVRVAAFVNAIKSEYA